MKQSNRRAKTSWTYADYLTWSEDERWEIIDGEAFDMTPAPSSNHQEISANLIGLLWSFLREKPCKVFHAPFDVRFPKKNEADEEIRDVVQPDIAVICDMKKIDAKGCRGAPDFIIEILSPSTSSKDHLKKRRLYEQHGVKEYWLVDPEGRIITIYQTEGKDRFSRPFILGADEEIQVSLFPGLTIDFRTVFPPEKKVVRESPRTYSANP